MKTMPPIDICRLRASSEEYDVVLKTMGPDHTLTCACIDFIEEQSEALAEAIANN